MAKNDKFLEELQKKLMELGNPWVAEETEISKLSEDEFKLRLGYAPAEDEMSYEELEEASKKNYEKLLAGGEADTAPSSIDWTNNGGNYVSPVKNQGSCGSCVAFAANATVESRVKIIRDLPEGATGADKLESLSEEQLFFCGNPISNPCGTGWHNFASVDYFKSTGVAPASCYPYVATNSACGIQTSCPDWKSEVTKISNLNDTNGNPIGYKGISSISDMKNWISTNGPLQTRFNIYGDFRHYSNGTQVYKHTGNGPILGGHAVSVVGYDDNKGGGAWKCKNSWGTSWAGNGGFFWIGYGQCGIDAYMYAYNAFDSIYPFHNYTTILPEGTMTYSGGTYSGSNTTPIWTPLNPNQYTGVNGKTGFQSGDIIKVVATFNLDPSVTPQPGPSDYKGLSLGACSSSDAAAITALQNDIIALPSGNTGQLIGTGITNSDAPSATDVFYNATPVTKTMTLSSDRGSLTNYTYEWYMVYNGNNTVVTNGDDVEIVCGYGVGMTSEPSTKVVQELEMN